MSLWRFRRRPQRVIHVMDLALQHGTPVRAPTLCGREFALGRRNEVLLGEERRGLDLGMARNGESVSCEKCVDEGRARIRELEAVLEGRR